MKCPNCDCGYVERRGRNPRTGEIIWHCNNCGSEWEMHDRRRY